MAEKRPSRLRNLTIVGISALAGVATLVVVMTALLVGLWLDAQLGLRGPATIFMLVASVPISLLLMIWITLSLIKRLSSHELPKE